MRTDTDPENEQRSGIRALEREWARAFGQRLLAAVEASNTSLNGLDRAADRSVGYSSRMISAAQMPGGRFIALAARQLGVRYEYLLDGALPMMAAHEVTVISGASNFSQTLAASKSRWPHVPDEVWDRVSECVLSPSFATVEPQDLLDLANLQMRKSSPVKK